MRNYIDIIGEANEDTIENEIHQMGYEHGEEGNKYKYPAKVFAKLYNTQDMATIKQYTDLYYKGIAAGKNGQP